MCGSKSIRKLSQLITRNESISREDKINFTKFFSYYDNIAVLSGAGISTESGIPDYRSAFAGLLNRPNYTPINYLNFVKNPDVRKQYWTRNFIGWPKFSTTSPNITHYTLANYEILPEKISGIITQNVDCLHNKAGSVKIIELHGNLYWVHCLTCKNLINRFDFQVILKNLNPHININSLARPDGYVEINEEIYKNFQVPDCQQCGGILKPTVVFFGDSVPKKRVDKVKNLIENSEALLVLGTTLSTQSSFKILYQAFELCKFICIVNIGPTKGDKYADLIINTKCSECFKCLKSEFF